MDFLRSHALAFVLSALPIGGLVFLVTQWCKRTFAGINETSPLVKRAYVLAGAAALSALATFLNVGPSPCPVTSETVGAVSDCLAGLSPDFVKTVLLALISSGGAFLLHAGKDSQPKP